MELLGELIALIEEFGVLAEREAEIRRRSAQLLTYLAAAIQSRSGNSQPVKVEPQKM